MLWNPLCGSPVQIFLPQHRLEMPTSRRNTARDQEETFEIETSAVSEDMDTLEKLNSTMTEVSRTLKTISDNVSKLIS